MNLDNLEPPDVVDLLMSYRTRHESMGGSAAPRIDLAGIHTALEATNQDVVDHFVEDTEKIRQSHHAFDLAGDLLRAGDVDRAKHWLSVAAESDIDEAATLLTVDLAAAPSSPGSRQAQVHSESDMVDTEDSIIQALIRAKENAEHALRDSEARFEEIFTASSVGMAISDVTGTLIRTNPALADILGYQKKIDVLNLGELFHADEADYLRLRYDLLLEEHACPFRERRSMRRADGEMTLVFLAASVLRDPDGTPRYFVTTIEDVSSRHFLESQLQFQATHDALTGLANRFLFLHRLEEALASDHREHPITLFHLNLDGFRTINNGLGREVGDRLLQSVGSRLHNLFVDETAVIARLDGDEFAVLLENGSDTPPIASLASRINDELAEPIYIGDQGIATTASIAVMPDPPPSSTPAELLRATDIVLGRLKATGRRQWSVVDTQQNDRDQARFTLAGSLPGAWENGEISLASQPLVSIVDHDVVAMQALLRWNHAEHGHLDHARCLEVLAETGMSVPVGQWMLRSASEQLRTWIDQHNTLVPKLYVELTKEFAADPDLVSIVQTVLTDSALSPRQLQLGMPVQALCMLDGLAEDNLDVLADIGVAVVLYEFGTTSGDLACLEDLPVQAIKMSSRVVSRVDRMGDDAIFTRGIRQLVPLIRETGTPVIVGDIASQEQLDWWRATGVDLVQGTFHGLTERRQKVNRPRMMAS